MNRQTNNLTLVNQLDTEINNIRALPFGFVAICEHNDLKLRAKNSATFVIRNSELCQYLPKQQQQNNSESIILCSNDPHIAEHAEQTIAKCSELDKHEFATEV